MKKAANFLDKIKSLLKNEDQFKTEKFIIAQKSCPHCASRGLFIFNSQSSNQNKNPLSNENKK